MRLTHIIILSGVLLCSGAPQQLKKIGERAPLLSRSNEQALRSQQSVRGVQENHVRFKTGGGIDATESTATIHSPQDEISADGLQRARRSTVVKSDSISWISPEGQKISMNYNADENGFRLHNNGFSIEDTAASLPAKSKAPSSAPLPLPTGSNLSVQDMKDRAAQEFGYGRKYYFATRHGSRKQNSQFSENLTQHQVLPPSKNLAPMQQPQSPPHISTNMPSPSISLLPGQTSQPLPVQLVLRPMMPTQSGPSKTSIQSSTPSFIPMITMQPIPRPTLPSLTAQSTLPSLSLESLHDLPISALPGTIRLPLTFNQPTTSLQRSSLPVDLAKSSLATTNRLADLRQKVNINNALSSSEHECNDFIPDPALFKMDPKNLSLSDRQQLLHYILVALTTESRIDGCSHGCAPFGNTRNVNAGIK